VCQADAFDAMQNKAKADGGDATTRHMAQLQDHSFVTAAARPDNAIDTLVLMALAYTCWDKGVRESGPPDSAEVQRQLLQPGAVLRALGQVIEYPWPLCMTSSAVPAARHKSARQSMPTALITSPVPKARNLSAEVVFLICLPTGDNQCDRCRPAGSRRGQGPHRAGAVPGRQSAEPLLRPAHLLRLPGLSRASSAPGWRSSAWTPRTRPHFALLTVESVSCLRAAARFILERSDLTFAA